MALNSLGMGFVFTAKDLATGVIKKVRNEYINTFQTAQQGAAAWRKVTGSMAAGSAAVGAGMLAIVGGGALANVAGEFEQTIAAVAQITDATAGQLTQLHDAAIDAALSTQFSPLEAALGLQELGSAGLNATGAMNALTPVLQLAASSLGQISVPESAEAVVSVLNSFGIAAKDANVVVDQLVQSANKSNLQFRDMRIALANSAAAAVKANQSFETTLSLLGAVRNTGKDASSAATSVREALNRLSMPIAQKHLTNLIGEDGWIDKQKGQIKDFAEIFKAVDKQLSKMGPGEHAKKMETLYRIYGTRGDSLYNAIKNFRYEVVNNMGQVEKVLTGVEGWELFRKQHSAEAASGAAERYMDKLLDTFKGQKDLLRGVMQTFAVGIGEMFAKAWKPVVKFLVQSLKILAEYIAKMPDGMKKFFGWLLTLVPLTMIFAGAMTMLVAIIPVIKAGFAALGISLGAFVSALWPILLGLAAVALIAVVVYTAFKKNFGGVQELFAGLVERISLGWQALSQMFDKGFVDGDVAEKLLAGDSGFLTYVITIYNALQRIGHFFQNVWKGMMEYIEGDGAGAFKPVVTALGEMWQAVTASFDAVKDLLNALSPGGIGSVAQGIGKWLGQVFSFVATSVAWLFSILSGLWQGIAGGFIAFVLPALTGLWDSLMKLGAAVGELFENLGLYSSGGGAGFMDFLKAIAAGIGVIVMFMVGLTVRIISGIVAVTTAIIQIVGEVARVIGGVIDIVVGLIQMIFGLFTGNTEMMGTGFRNMIMGFTKVVLGFVGILLQALGLISDAFTGLVNLGIKALNLLPGADLAEIEHDGQGWATKTIDGLEKSIDANLNIGKSATAAAQASTPGVEATSAFGSMMSEQAPVNVSVNANLTTTLDGKEIHTAVEQISSDEEHELRGGNLSFAVGY